MKKGLFLLSLLFLLTGCGEETKEDVIQEVPKQATVHCELSSRDVINGYETTAEYTIYYTGDYVFAQTVKIGTPTTALMSFTIN